MKILIEEKTTRELQIELPAYYEYGFSKFKVLSNDAYVEVRQYVERNEFSIGHKISIDNLAFVIGKGESITEREFNLAYFTALNQITALHEPNEYAGAPTLSLHQ